MNDQNPHIDSLISLCLSGKASQQEMQELEDWLNASSDNRKLFEYLKEVWKAPVPDEYTDGLDRIRDRIWEEGTGKKKDLKYEAAAPINKFYWAKVAAVLLFLVAAWQFSFLFRGRPEVKEPVVWVEKKNPSGQRSTHLLPDGTKVWLNVGSSLIYPAVFLDTMRWVRLNGEAFFEVANDPKRPFIVEASAIKTRVLGTAFNVKAYSEDLEVIVSLLEGKVQVQDSKKKEMTVLLPGEELLAFKDKREFTKQNLSHEAAFGWKEGILLFDGDDFASFRKKIEQWFGVEITVYGSAPEDWNIRARYQRESLQHVLEDISFNKNIRFEVDKEKVTITF